MFGRRETRDRRRRRAAQARLVHNLACLLTILQRKIMPIPAGAGWGRLMFNHYGELIGVSLPNGVTVGTGKDCNVRRPLVDGSAPSISHGRKSWKFLLILACNEFNTHIAAELKPKDQTLTVHICNKFAENVQIEDSHVSDLNLIFDDCRMLLGSMEQKYCLTNNYLHHLPNMPLYAAQDMPKFSTLLQSRLNCVERLPKKIFYPVLPPDQHLPTILY